MAKSKMAAPVTPDHRYEVEDALRCMTRAEEIRHDSKLMGEVKKLAAEKKSHLSRVAATQPRTKSASRKAK